MLPFKSAVTLNELNEHELEERLYAMLHHVDETEGNLASNHSDVQKDPAAPSNNNKPGDVNQTNQTPEEKHDSTPKPPSHALSLMLQNPVPQNLQVTIEIIEQDDERAVVLEYSDEDEFIEVALPPKPTFINTTESHSISTPSKTKKRKRTEETKLYAVTEKSTPNPDVYDSDSNQSMDTNNNRNSYIVTEKSLPSTDVYESDSNWFECAKEISGQIQSDGVKSSDINKSVHKPCEQPSKTSKKNESIVSNNTIIDLTCYESFVNIDESDIQESIIMENVSGFTEYEDYGDANLSKDISQFGSTKIPSILNENLDFDHLKGKGKVCKGRGYSLTTVRAEMEKFYNESWGGENFNHREIQKSMSRDESLWVIDPKDRVPSLDKRKITCNYCNCAGHRDDTCRLKPPVCYMCGSTGHFEQGCPRKISLDESDNQFILGNVSRFTEYEDYGDANLSKDISHFEPRKICVNCGSPNQMYTHNMCRNCCNWGALQSAVDPSSSDEDELHIFNPISIKSIINPKINGLKIKVNGIPKQLIHHGIKEKRVEPTGRCSNPHVMKKLAFFLKRLMSTRPAAAALKKTRADLVMRLHTAIASLFRKQKLSSKKMKAVKKLQEQAQLFLSNV